MTSTNLTPSTRIDLPILNKAFKWCEESNSRNGLEANITEEAQKDGQDKGHDLTWAQARREDSDGDESSRKEYKSKVWAPHPSSVYVPSRSTKLSYSVVIEKGRK